METKSVPQNRCWIVKTEKGASVKALLVRRSAEHLGEYEFIVDFLNVSEWLNVVVVRIEYIKSIDVIRVLTERGLNSAELSDFFNFVVEIEEQLCTQLAKLIHELFGEDEDE